MDKTCGVFIYWDTAQQLKRPNYSLSSQADIAGKSQDRQDRSVLYTCVRVGGRNCKEGQGSQVSSLSGQGVVTNREGARGPKGLVIFRPDLEKVTQRPIKLPICVKFRKK